MIRIMGALLCIWWNESAFSTRSRELHLASAGLSASTLATRPHAPPVLLCGSGEDFGLMSRAVASGVYDYVPLP